MPSYNVETPFGNFTLDSDRELSNEEIVRNLQQSGLMQPQEAERPEIGQTPAPPTPPAPTDYIGRTTRRLSEAGEALIDVPGAAGRLVVGSEKGRLAEALRLLQGMGAIISPATAPVEAAVEHAAVGLGASEETGRIAGDVGGVVGALGVGLLAKAGKLGNLGLQLARILGVGAPGKDPHLDYIRSREPGPAKGVSELEELARTDTPIDVLARKAKSGPIAEASVQAKATAHDQWTDFMDRTGLPISEPPPLAEFKTPNISFQQPGTSWAKAVGRFLGAIGTPATRAGAIHPRAGALMYDMQLVEAKIGQAITARQTRNLQSLGTLTDDELKMLAQLREKPLAPEKAALLPQKVRQGLEYLENKFEVDRKIIQSRLREIWRPRVERQIEEEFYSQSANYGKQIRESGDLTPPNIKALVEERVNKLVPNDWGIDKYLPHIWPGEYKILDKSGRLLGSANTRLEAKFLINDLAEKSGLEASDFTVKASSYMDLQTLKAYRGRVKQVADDLAEAGPLTTKEIDAAIKGDYGSTREFKFFGSLLEREKGKAKGYSTDVHEVLGMYDRGLERWMQLSDYAQRSKPVMEELAKKGYGYAVDWHIRPSLDALWGARAPLGQYFDDAIAATPGLSRVAPYALERWTRGAKAGIVNTFLKFNPRFHAVNSTQLAATLWPIAGADDIARGFRLRRSTEGQALLRQHGVSEVGTKIEALKKGLGPSEKMNQEVSFLTMYNKGRQLGLSDLQAADYAILRGNIYSQFLGLTTDQPTAFRGPLMSTTFMFQRFPIKNLELAIDMIKDKNFAGVAKWMSVNLLLGGFKAATLGQAGWFGYKLYRDIQKEYGAETADAIQYGLPSLIGIDLSNSVMFYNPPFGDSAAEKMGNLVLGPVGGLITSSLGAAMDTKGVEPNAAKRAFDAVMQRVPMLKSLDAIRRLWEDDYDFKTPSGELRYKGDAKAVIKQLLGAKPIVHERKGDVDMDTFISALLIARKKRDAVLDYAASRSGQAAMAGIPLSQDHQEAIEQEVVRWNTMFPEFPIGGTDIVARARRRRASAMRGLRERLLRQSPLAIRRGMAGGMGGGEEEEPQ